MPALGTLEADDAAALLGVSADTLLRWEARFGAPSVAGWRQGRLLYHRGEVEALNRALPQAPSVACALRLARLYAQGRPPLPSRRAPHPVS